MHDVAIMVYQNLYAIELVFTKSSSFMFLTGYIFTNFININAHTILPMTFLMTALTGEGSNTNSDLPLSKLPCATRRKHINNQKMCVQM